MISFSIFCDIKLFVARNTSLSLVTISSTSAKGTYISSNWVMTIIGPNDSSFAMYMSSVTSVKMVGSRKNPVAHKNYSSRIVHANM